MIELNFPNPVSSECDFFNRRTEWERIVTMLRTGARRSIVVSGERRIGKTSFLTITLRRLAALPGVSFVPFVLPPVSTVRSAAGYAQVFLRSLCHALGKSLADLGLSDRNERGEFESVGQFGDAVVRAVGNASGSIWVAGIDEFDAILRHCPAAEAAQIRGLTDYLIEMAEKAGLPVLIYRTVTYLPDAGEGVYGAPEIPKAEVVELGPFAFEDFVELANGLVGPRLRFEADALTVLFELSGGHPYFVKLLLDRLLAVPGLEEGAVSTGRVEQVVPAAARDRRAGYALENIYKVHLDHWEQQMVLLLAERQGQGVGEAELRGLGVEYRTAANRLCRRGYLIEKGNGRYDFRIGFWGWWLRHWEEFEEEADCKLDGLRFRLAGASAAEG